MAIRDQQDSFRDTIDRTRREVAERDKRIAELEKELEIQKYHAGKGYELGYQRGSDAATDNFNKLAEARVVELKKEVDAARAELAKDCCSRAPACCGDAHQQLEWMLKIVKESGFEEERIKHESFTEVIYHNRRAEAAEARIVELQGERDKVNQEKYEALNRLHETMQIAEARRGAAEAEVSRLKEDLQYIYHRIRLKDAHTIRDVIERIEAALSESGKGAAE